MKTFLLNNSHPSRKLLPFWMILSARSRLAVRSVAIKFGEESGQVALESYFLRTMVFSSEKFVSKYREHLTQRSDINNSC